MGMGIISLVLFLRAEAEEEEDTDGQAGDKNILK